MTKNRSPARTIRPFTRFGGPVLSMALGLAAALASLPLQAAPPALGSNVIVFDPSMALSDIENTVNALASQQLGNQFGTQRYALLFQPGVYGSSDHPLNFQVGYYTTVAGLGSSPGDVVINGSVNVYNQCDSSGSCIALNNFWRSLSNLTINVANASLGCHSGEFWAVSQAAPMRRVAVNGQTTLMDYCSGPSFASGGFIADSSFNGTVINGSQQQWITRNSEVGNWTNGVWNQVFSGVVGAPAQCFPAAPSCGGPYTTLASSPVTREAPYLTVDGQGKWQVFAPALAHNSSGTSWGVGATPGHTLPLSDFYIAHPGDTARRINRALMEGRHLLLTPGVYALEEPLVIGHPGTVVLGLGMPTLVPQHGTAALEVTADHGVLVSALIVDAGPQASEVLLRVGRHREERGDAHDDDDRDDHGGKHAASEDPNLLSDVFFRIGGATAGSTRTAVTVHSDGTILDNLWIWRADHGNGAGWDSNTADTGLVVEGRNVTAYGLAVEHFQKTEVDWRGSGGQVIFFQNEMPYDPPSQAAWTQADGTRGYPAFKVSASAATFRGWGWGSYSNFNQGVAIYADRAFEVPATLPRASLQDLFTVFLNSQSSGGILNVIDQSGGPSVLSNADTPVVVPSYP